MSEPPRTVFLDQNKWIDLAHAFENPKRDARLYEIGCGLIEAIKSGRIQCPLTSGLLIETYRMSDDQHRMMIAEVQSILSQGRVFRDRDFMIRHEIARLIRTEVDYDVPSPPEFWWMSKYFIEAFVDIPRAINHFGLQQDQLNGISADPKFALFHWISTAPEQERNVAMDSYEAGSRALIERINLRIDRLKGQQFSLRQKVYSASLAIDEIDRILSVGMANGLNWNSLSDIGPKRLKFIMRNVPAYHVETALASRIEATGRSIKSNDLRDMASYVSAIPNTDVLVGEKLFVNLAKQGGLGKQFGCELHSDIYKLEAVL